MPNVNWLAILVATLAAFAIGGLWYSALFAKPWQRAAGVTTDQLADANPARIFGGAFALTFVAATVFAVFLGPSPGIRLGAGAGAAAGVCWVAAMFGVNYLFERRSLRLFLINGGYNALAFTTIGTILGAMS